MMDTNNPVTMTALGLIGAMGGGLVLALVVGFFVGLWKGRTNGKA